jgi:uncharacterized membrane protein
MAVICAVWFGWLTYLTLHRFHGLHFGAFDLGIFDQGMWLIANGHEPFVTLRGLHLLGDHASYLLYLLAPLYWLWEEVRLLLLLTVLIPVVAGWLSYRIARVEGLRPWHSVIVGTTVLLMPAMLWTPWDAFHPETFAIALIPASYLAARKGKHTLALILAALVLLAKEDAGLTIAPYALYWWWRWRDARKHAYVLAALAVGVTALSLFVVLPGHSPTGELIYTGRYSDLAATLTWSRLYYLVGMIVPGLAALRAPAFLLLGLPVTLANLLSTHTYQSELRWHYTAYLLGVLAVAVPLGSARWTEGSPDRLASRRLALAGLVALVAMLVIGPDLHTRSGLWGGLDARERAEVAAILDAIPPDASVTATWSLTPHLSHRREIYTSPNPFRESYWGAEHLPPLPDPSTVEYLAIDTRNFSGPEDPMPDVMLRPEYETVVDGETFKLLRRR